MADDAENHTYATKLLAGCGAALVAALFGIFFICLTTISGLIVGWVVGWFFTETILGIFAALGIKGFAMWQVGAWLGFVSGFFRTVKTTPKT